MTDDQRQEWHEALAEVARSKHGDRSRRYRQQRTGLAAVSGPGRIRVRIAPPDDGGGEGDDTGQTSAPPPPAEE